MFIEVIMQLIPPILEKKNPTASQDEEGKVEVEDGEKRKMDFFTLQTHFSSPFICASH